MDLLLHWDLQIARELEAPGWRPGRLPPLQHLVAPTSVNGLVSNDDRADRVVVRFDDFVVAKHTLIPDLRLHLVVGLPSPVPLVEVEASAFAPRTSAARLTSASVDRLDGVVPLDRARVVLKAAATAAAAPIPLATASSRSPGHRLTATRLSTGGGLRTVR